MSFFSSMNISASGLTAQRVRQDVIAENIANVDTTRTAEGGPYRRKVTLFQERTQPDTQFASVFGSTIKRASAGDGVRVAKITVDTSEGTKVYEPGHPDADADGYVTKPNVNIVNEMVNMIASTRSYEANITAMNATKAMISKTLEISSR
ncbi:flagellar basal-body rod protein FlgC [Clostridia bacterium]|nr:flagellar basal-body rod protein FlgC [Clostridia bacterium]